MLLLQKQNKSKLKFDELKMHLNDCNKLSLTIHDKAGLQKYYKF